MTNTALIKRHEEDSITIPDQAIDQVAALSDDLAIWAKLVNGGFKFSNQEKILPELVGRIRSLTPYLIRFENGVPTKLPHIDDDLQIPEGFERRCDLKIDMDGQIVGLSLAPSTIKHHLSPYVKFLKNQGLRPDQVTTKIQSRQASNSMGTWSVAVFAMVDSREPGRQTKETPSEQPQSDLDFPKEWE